MATIVNRNDIILQATSPRVDVSISTVDYSELTDNLGIQPDDNADVTLVNTAANVTGQTGFATLDKINSGNVGTYIDNLAIKNAQIASASITEAKIGSLAVSTLKIQDNAVTVPVATQASSTINIGTGGYVTIQSATITLTATSDVFITAGVWIDSQAAVSNALYRISSSRVRLLRGGTAVKSHAFTYNWSIFQSVTFKESLSAGTYTYHLQQYNNWANTGFIPTAGYSYDRYVSILGVAK